MKLMRLVDDALDRLRPDRDRHFVVVPRLKLVYGRIPKVANTAIRGVLAAHLDLKPGVDLPANKDRFWDGEGAHDAALVSGRTVLARYQDHLSFTIVRNPFDRAVSCWSNMVGKPKVFLPSFERLGFRPGQDFATFLDRIADIPDRRSDLHFRSQASMLTVDGRVVPRFVGRYERLDEDWAHVRAEVAALTGIDLGDLPKVNVRRRDRSDVLALFADRRLVELVLARYADDFRLFYPDQREPEAGPRV
jgi:hypothetical protein